MTQTLGSLRKALIVIDQLAVDGQDVGVSELARRTGLAKNQVYRILKTLEEFDYIHQCENRSYQLSFKFVEIGQGILRDTDLRQIALPMMKSVRDATGETVNLIARDGLQAACIGQAESAAAVRMSAQVGRRFPIHGGACPKAIFAHQPDDVVTTSLERYGMHQYTSSTITDIATLRRVYEQIRRVGFAESNEDTDEHVYAVGVPITNRDGDVIAAMSVAGPMFRFDRSRRDPVVKLLCATCNQISALLGSSRVIEVLLDLEPNGEVVEAGIAVRK